MKITTGKDITTREIMKFVRYAKTDSDAIYNIQMALKEYDKRKTFWQLIKLLLNK